MTSFINKIKIGPKINVFSKCWELKIIKLSPSSFLFRTKSYAWAFWNESWDVFEFYQKRKSFLRRQNVDNAARRLCLWRDQFSFGWFLRNINSHVVGMDSGFLLSFSFFLKTFSWVFRCNLRLITNIKNPPKFLKIFTTQEWHIRISIWSVQNIRSRL